MAKPPVFVRVQYSRQRKSVFTLLGVSVLCAASILATSVIGQDESASANSAFPNVIEGGVLKTQARLWFPDEDGRPVLVPDSSLEEMYRLRAERSGGADGASQWNFETFDVTIDATDVNSRVAMVGVDIEVRRGATKRTTTIPLRLNSLRLSEPPTIEKSDDQAFRPTADGYAWRLGANSDASPKLALRGKTVVSRDGDRRLMTITLPMTQARILLRLPDSVSDVRTRDPNDVIEPQKAEGYTAVTILSVGGDVELSWSIGDSQTQLAAVEARTETTFDIRDPSQVWTAETNVDLRWYGVQAGRNISIALPAGARLRSLPSYDFELFNISSRFDGSGNDAIEVLEIDNYDIEQAPTLPLQLQWEWMPSVEEREGDSVVSVSCLNIDGVDLHRGKIDCVLQAQYNVALQTSDQITLISQSRNDNQKILSFEFDSQEYNLELNVRREQSVAIVRPTYHVKVDDNKLTLTGWLECSFDAKQPNRSIGIEIPNWILQENNVRALPRGESSGEAGEVIQVRASENSVGSYTLTRLESATPTFGDVSRIEETWRFVAQREIDTGDGLEIQVPEIVRDHSDGSRTRETGSGILLLTSAENLLLRTDSGLALLEDSYSEEYQKFGLSRDGRTPKVFRFQSAENIPFWAGTAQRLPQQIVASDHTAIRVLPDVIEVQRNYDLQIENTALAELRFSVPADVSQPPIAYVNDSLATVERIASAGDPSSSEASMALGKRGAPNYRLRAPANLLGSHQVRIRMEVPWRLEDEKDGGPNDSDQSSATEASGNSRSSDSGRIEVQLPELSLPESAAMTTSTWQLQSPGSLMVRPVDSSFEMLLDRPANGAADNPQPTKSPKWLLPEATDRIGLAIAQKNNQRGVRIRSAWLQTAITRVHRRDRFVTDVETPNGQLRLTLPKFIDDLDVIVNGESVADQRYDYASDVLVIDFDASSANDAESHLVEVSYFLQEDLSWLNRLRMDPPQIEGAQRIQEFQWELLTPNTQHILGCPDQLTSNWQWAWERVWWHRQSPNMDFEEELGATKQPKLPPSMNRYVMSGNRLDTDVSVVIVSRFALWFPVGLLSILITYCLLNFSVCRRPPAMLGYAGALATVALVFPDFSMLVGQTTLIALSVVGLLWMTQIAVDARVRRRSVFNSRSISPSQDSRTYNSGRIGKPSGPSLPSTQPAGGSSIAASEGQ